MSGRSGSRAEDGPVEAVAGHGPTAPVHPPEGCYDLGADAGCFLCGRRDGRRVVREVGHFGIPLRFERCRCGLVQQTPIPNRRFFEWFFNSAVFTSGRRHAGGKIWGFYDYFPDEPSRRATAHLRYRRLAHRLGLDASRHDVLEVGAATGTFLHVLREHGHRVTGCEMSERFVASSRASYGLELRHGAFEEAGFPEASFDLVVLFNVIENVPGQAAFFRELHRVLRPGGTLVLNFVDMRHNLLAALQGERYFLYRPPVCFLYEGRVLEAVIDRFGFAVSHRLRDLRFLTVEKVVTLLGLRRAPAVARALGIARRPFPLYAYPSKLWLARRRPAELPGPPAP